MRLLPHRIYMMSLRGRKSLHGRPLPSKQEALAGLLMLTGQDFGEDVEQWGYWLRENWRTCYRRGPQDNSEQHP